MGRDIRVLIAYLLLYSVGLLFPPPAASMPGYGLYQPPGRMIDMGGYKQHIYCVGAGAPTIVLESGLAGFSLEWYPLEARLARYQRVCSYDRTGYGWSDYSPLPRTADHLAEELHRLLRRAGEAPPYLLVGHSFGGYIVQDFSRRHPHEVQGLVLIDASHPLQMQRLKPRARDLKAVRYDGRRLHSRIIRSWPTLPAHYPPSSRILALHLMSGRKSTLTQLSEWENFSLSGSEVLQAGPMPDIPVVVMSRGRRMWPATAAGDAKAVIWQQLQAELTDLTPQTYQIIASSSGHHIHLDQPELVFHAIRSLANRAQECRPAPVRVARREVSLREGYGC